MCLSWQFFIGEAPYFGGFFVTLNKRKLKYKFFINYFYPFFVPTKRNNYENI